MIIRKDETRKVKNSDACTVQEYDFPSKDLGVATAQINGNYPEKDWCMNEICDTIDYITSGRGTIYCGEDVFEVKPGDAVFIKKGINYKLFGERLEIVEINAPAWSPQQYKSVK